MVKSNGSIRSSGCVLADLEIAHEAGEACSAGFSAAEHLAPARVLNGRIVKRSFKGKLGRGGRRHRKQRRSHSAYRNRGL